MIADFAAVRRTEVCNNTADIEFGILNAVFTGFSGGLGSGCFGSLSGLHSRITGGLIGGLFRVGSHVCIGVRGRVRIGSVVAFLTASDKSHNHNESQQQCKESLCVHVLLYPPKIILLRICAEGWYNYHEPHRAFFISDR